jgi:hypothetical protein
MAAFLGQARSFIRWHEAEVHLDEGSAAAALNELATLAEAAASRLSADAPAAVVDALGRVGTLACLVAIAGDQVDGAATERLGEDVATVFLWAERGR